MESSCDIASLDDTGIFADLFEPAANLSQNFNPFEPPDFAAAMLHYCLNFSVFDEQPESSSSFKWSIDHMSTLHPADISQADILRTESLKFGQSESDETAAQANIRKFFEQLNIPSPLSSQPASIVSSGKSASINQSINQSIDRSIDGSINQSINQSINRSIDG